MSAALAAGYSLAPGVTVALLRRVWNATPANRRHERATLLDSIVRVNRAGVAEASPLRELTLAEVEAAIGAVTPRYVVRFYEPGKRGIQACTFLNHADASRFASGKRLYGGPAEVKELTREALR